MLFYCYLKDLVTQVWMLCRTCKPESKGYFESEGFLVVDHLL